MGIEKFHSLVKIYKERDVIMDYPRDIKRIYVDANNFIFIHIKSWLSFNNKPTAPNRIVLAYRDTLKIIRHVLLQINKFVNVATKSLSNDCEVYFVFDPEDGIGSYVINSDHLDQICSSINISRDHYFNITNDNVTNDITLISKENEHLRRLQHCVSIKSYDEYCKYCELTKHDESFKVQMYNEYALIHLSNYDKDIIRIVRNCMRNVNIIMAHREADLTIRRLVVDYCNDHEEGNVIVASADTDYFLLVGDIDRTYVMDLGKQYYLNYNTRLYRPYWLWSSILDTNDVKYELIVRLAISMGIDYTVVANVKERVVSAPHISPLLQFIGIDNDKIPDGVKVSRITKVNKVYEFYNVFRRMNVKDRSKMSQCEILDNVIKSVTTKLKNDMTFNELYIRSLLLYLNYYSYGEYDVLKYKRITLDELKQQVTSLIIQHIGGSCQFVNGELKYIVE